MILKVYGVISKIYEPGTFAKCIPVFVNLAERKKTKFYRLDDSGKIIQIDLGQFGTPVFLPASRKKINDEKEYFIVYRSSQNVTKRPYMTYLPDDITICTDRTVSWMVNSLSVGIEFPDKFVCVLASDIDDDRLKNMMK